MSKRKSYNLSSGEIKRIIREFTTVTLIAAPIFAICYVLALTATGRILGIYSMMKESNNIKSNSQPDLIQANGSNRNKQDNIFKKDNEKCQKK